MPKRNNLHREAFSLVLCQRAFRTQLVGLVVSEADVVEGRVADQSCSARGRQDLDSIEEGLGNQKFPLKLLS